MPTPITLTVVYLAVNLPLMYWLERERARGRMPARRVAALSSALRYGPPLVGVGYLVTISGDWLFVLFVGAFFVGGFWLLDGLLAYPNTSDRSKSTNGGRRDRGAAAPSRNDRDRA